MQPAGYVPQQSWVLQHPPPPQTPPVQNLGPGHMQHVQFPKLQTVPSGSFVVMQPPAPSQTELVWHSFG